MRQIDLPGFQVFPQLRHVMMTPAAVQTREQAKRANREDTRQRLP